MMIIAVKSRKKVVGHVCDPENSTLEYGVKVDRKL
jgi:hypothetical protein